VSVRTRQWSVGTPCWVDLATADADGASTFYSDLFGWEIRSGPPEVGGYRMALLRGSVVGGIRPVAHGASASWTTHLAAADAGASLRRVVEAGGRVVSGPVSLLTEGAIALAQDPTGVPFGMWEPGELIGAELVNEPGSFCWAELLSHDPVASSDFSTRVFGHAYSDRGGADFSYAMIRVGDVAVAGAAAIGPPRFGEPPVHPQWLVYFSVDDTDAAGERVQALGGLIEVPSTETRHGRMSLARGRSGELFGLLEADDLPRTSPGD
jgi:uncharacterized protein